MARKPLPTVKPARRSPMTWLMCLLLVLAAGAVVHGVEAGRKTAPTPAPTPYVLNVEKLAEVLESRSVTVRSPAGQGSGTIFVHGKKQYVLTAGHVVQEQREGASEAEIVMGLAGMDGFYYDLQVLRYDHPEDIVVGRVIAYSHPERGDDLAILELDGAFNLPYGGAFIELFRQPLMGEEIYHIGGFLGLPNGNSFSHGPISRVHRTLRECCGDHDFMQTACPAYPGSSGGGMFYEDGALAGVLVRGANATLNYCVPASRVVRWAKANGFMWVFDPSEHPQCVTH